MAQPPSPPSPAPPGGPAPLYPLYPPYWYYPPPKRDNLALIIVIIVIVVVAVPIVLAAVLYVLVSGLIGTPEGPPPIVPPMVSFGSVDQTGGNATLYIASTSISMDASSLRFRLDANYSLSPANVLPPPDGSVLVQVAEYTHRVWWLDDGDGQVGPSDAFRITGDGVPLPGQTAFSFSLERVDTRTRTGRAWTTA